jgi:hypothetical protein
MGRGVLGLGLALLVSACAREAVAPRTSEALERSARLLARLDQLEADLHEEGSRLALYGELEQRHGQTSQIACQVADEHVQEIHRLAMAQERKQAAKMRVRRAVAQARVIRRGGDALN